MKSKFPNALADALKKSGLTQRALAELANTTQQQIGRLLHGNREMTAQWAERFAPSLSVRPEELLFPNLKRTRVPLFSWVSAGRLASEDGVRKSDVRKYISANDLPKGNWMALEVQGDSMDRVAPDGSIIFVNKDDQRLIDNGFYVFATASGEATFKRYRVGPRPRLQPFSTNPDHETIYLAEDMHVIGRVGRVVTDLI